MTDVFISYSRKDKAFAEKLFSRLESAGRDSWIDWGDIPSSAQWWQEIQEGIEAADNFVLILTPDSLSSPVCTLEIAHASKVGKRVVPVVHVQPQVEAALGKIAAVQPDEILKSMLAGRDLLLVARDNWTHIGHINWIFFRDEDDFEQAFAKLVETIETDLDHVKTHTRLYLRALEWERKGRRPDTLLIGDEIAAAEAWLAAGESKKPAPLDLHRTYIQESRMVEENRKRVLRNLRRATGVLALVGVLAVVVTLVAFSQASNAATREGLANTQVAVVGQTLTPVPQTLTPVGQTLAAGGTQIAAAQEQVQIAGQTLTPIPLTLQAGSDLLATATNAQGAALADASHANLLANDAQTSVAFAQATLTPAGMTLEAANAQIGAAQEQAALSNALAVTAQNRADIAGQTLTPVPLTLTPVALTLQAGSQQVATAQQAVSAFGQTLTPIAAELDAANTRLNQANQQVVNANQTLTPIAVTLVAAETQVRTQSLVSLSEQLAAEARPLAQDRLDLSLLLSIQAFRIADSVHIGRGEALNSLLNGLNTSTYNPRYLKGYSDAVTSVTFSPDGKLIASSGRNEDARLWDATTGQLVMKLSPSFGAGALAFSPDGKILAVGLRKVSDTEPTRVSLFDVSSGKVIADLVGSERDQQINDLDFSPDGKRLIAAYGINCDNTCGAQDFVARIWNVQSHQLAGTIKWDSAIQSAAYSPDGKLIALVDAGSLTLQLWNAATFASVPNPAIDNYNGYIGFNSAYFMPDGKLVGIGGEAGSNHDYIFDLTSGDVQEVSVNGSIPFQTNQYQGSSPDGKTLVLAANNEIHLWDVATKQFVGAALKGHLDDVNAFAFSPDGQTLVSGGEDHTIIIWHLNGGNSPVKTLLTSTDSFALHYDDVAISPDQKLLAVPFIQSDTTGSNNTSGVIFLDAQTGQEVRRLTQGLISTPPESLSIKVAFDYAGHLLVLWLDYVKDSQYQCEIYTLDAVTGEQIGDPYPSCSLAVDPTGQWLIVDSQTEHSLYDLKTQTKVHTFSGYINIPAFSPDNRFLFYNGSKLLNLETGEELVSPIENEINTTTDLLNPRSATFSPDGRYVAVGYAAGSIRLFDAATLQPVGDPMYGHTEQVDYLAFSPDSRILASADANGAVRFWDVPGGGSIDLSYPNPTGMTINALHYDQSGHLYIGNYGTVAEMDADPAFWIAEACQVANRDLTEAERAQYGITDDAPTCP